MHVLKDSGSTSVPLYVVTGLNPCHKAFVYLKLQPTNRLLPLNLGFVLQFTPQFFL